MAEMRCMSDEIFDVVNARNEVIGQRPRAEVHRLKLKHRAVHILVFNARGEVFLQKRSSRKDSCPGLWDSSAAGHLASGEEYDACAQRELREELGLTPETAPERLFLIEACDDTGEEFVWVYRCRAEGGLVLHPDEIEEGGWFAPETVTQWIEERPDELASSLRRVWREYSAWAKRQPPTGG